MLLKKIKVKISQKIGLWLSCLVLCLCNTVIYAEQIHIVYTSDQHYGIQRAHFRGNENVQQHK